MDSDIEFLDDDSKDELTGQDDDCFCLDTDTLNHLEELETDDECSYEVLNTEDIVEEMLETIKEVNCIVEIPPTITRILLNYFKWDKEKLYERYYDGDPESLFRDAHVVNPLITSENQMKSSKEAYELCEICFQNLQCDLMTSLACGHRYCSECWTTYLTRKIMDQGEVQTISCFAVDCDILVDDQTIMNLIDDQNVKLKYQYLITNSFISCNRHLRHCPFPGCDKVIKVQFVDAQGVTCSCGHSFCFQCGGNWHEPITCSLLLKWRTKCDNDSATLNWIAANTKECPKCKVRIEKNGGCNHMICKNMNCQREFCWICLRNWHSHSFSWNKCNRYSEDSKIVETRSVIKKFLFYFDRYKSHVQSLRFENKLYFSVQEKIDEMEDHLSWGEVQFLKKAVGILCQCRQTLTYTYVFAYYLKKNAESTIFEENQRDLQHATEQLSEYLERDINKENLRIMKPKVQDKYKYCENRRKILLDHVHEGYEKDSWEYEDQ